LPHKLIVVGKGEGEYVTRVLSYIEKHKLRDEVLIRGRVSDEELGHYYRHAEALVFPSFVEGFGFPVLEAFGCGVPVITSTTTSLPEVAGDAGLLVDPKNSLEIAGAMKRIVEDISLRKSLVEKGYLQMKKFSWGKSALIYGSLLKALVQKNSAV